MHLVLLWCQQKEVVKMLIGDRLKRLRQKNHMTQPEVSRMTGIQTPLYQRYETGKVLNIPYDKIETLAKIFGVSPAYIVGWGPDEAPEIVNSFNKLSVKNQQAVLQLVRALAE